MPAANGPIVLAAFSRLEADSLVESSSAEAIQHRGLEVSSKGNITATFSVPGLMTIPSDNVAHKVTIVKLSLDATMEWVSVPKSDAKVHLKAVIKNASEYTLLRGPASVYVDGSFISRSDVPPVSPEETFDCPLGIRRIFLEIALIYAVANATWCAQYDIRHRGLQVSSKGNITATFSVPGLMTIPSDNVAHKAVIKNASEYTLLRGPASVYVDGSFISRSDIPPVSPEETFDCPLGLDPSIRVTYHPLAKKLSQSGFMSRTRHYVFSQRITIHNTKSLAIDNLTIVDQIPVSEESSITVKLLSPPLSLPDLPATGTASSNSFLKDTKENKLGVRVPLPIKVSHGVVAQWDGVDDMNSDDGVENLGKDGKLNWVCSLPSQGKITLTLQWEVSAPLSSVDITGF
ncbi:hypothetical protein H1R20_g16569, partial [Candolleomyces eurysporus]